jgi:hypothetical protein
MREAIETCSAAQQDPAYERSVGDATRPDAGRKLAGASAWRAATLGPVVGPVESSMSAVNAREPVKPNRRTTWRTIELARPGDLASVRTIPKGERDLWLRH